MGQICSRNASEEAAAQAGCVAGNEFVQQPVAQTGVQRRSPSIPLSPAVCTAAAASFHLNQYVRSLGHIVRRS